MTGEGYFTTHDDAGRTLFAAGVTADITRHGSGITRALYRAQRKLCRTLNLRRIMARRAWRAMARCGTVEGYLPEDDASAGTRRSSWG